MIFQNYISPIFNIPKPIAMNVIIKRISKGKEEYILKEGDEKMLRIKYRNDLHTVRLETESDQRLLIIENEGLIKTRLSIKNEYGIEIGQMFFDNWSDKYGSVLIEGIRYRFQIKNSTTPELVFYKNSVKKISYQCLLSFETENRSDSKDIVSALLISTAWYLVLNGISETQSELIT